MIRTLRTKLLLGIAPLLLIMVAAGSLSVVMFTRLGGRIDVILKENYRSVLAAEGMKESLERMDSALLFAVGGEEARARAQFDEFRPDFDENLWIARSNVTLPGEEAASERLSALYARYLDLTSRFFDLTSAQKAMRTRLYFEQILPAFTGIKREADALLHLNQKNMEDESARARRAAAVSTRLMVVGQLGAAAVATVIAVALSRAILGPIQGVTRGARAVARGDFDQLVPVVSADELGELAAAFNTMARTIREYRQVGTARLLRAQMTAQATIDSFPDPVVVVDTGGVVERANPAARRLLHLDPAPGAVPWCPLEALRPALAGVLGGGHDALPTGLESAFRLRGDGQERYYLPRVLAIRDDRGDLLGAAVVLSDVTRFRLADQLKSDMVSTVSHELKTPLTGLQMTVHLLLEEAIGPLTAKQTELLLAARQDSDRLLAMINDLLDLTRIEQGRVTLDLRPVEPADLMAWAAQRFESQARDEGIVLAVDPAGGLPPVLADTERMEHVFGNLIGNALKHTGRGGSVTLTAQPDGPRAVRFSVGDTGVGIPAEHLPHIFEKFYRVVDRARPGLATGAGLGLAIAREIVTAHGGQIEARSEPGHGSAFSFTLAIATGDGHTKPGPRERKS